METLEMHKTQTLEDCERLETAGHLKTDDALNISQNNTEIGTSNNIQGNQEAHLIKNNEIEKDLIKNIVSPETQTIVLESGVNSEKNESPNMKKSDTTTPGVSQGYKSEDQKRFDEFCPKLKEILEQFSTKQYTPVEVQTKVKERPPHTFLSVIDTVLVIMESTLAGAHYILQNYREPRIPLEISNTMNSVRLAIETLKDHYAYTQEKHYEPISSILRELMSPSVELFQKIYPDLKIPNLEYYNEIHDIEECPTSPTPQDQNFRPDYLVIPRTENGTTMYDSYPPLEPRIAPRIPLFNTNKDPTLGILATGDGFIRLLLPCTFQIDFTIDQAIFVRNLKDKTVAAISACGTFSGLQTELCRVYHHGKTVDIYIKDSYNNKNMFAKMNDRGIYLGGTGALSNVQLKENGDIVTTDTAFQDLDDDFIKNIFLSNSVYGPEYYDICTDSLESVYKKVFADGSVHLTWKDIKIKQYKTGEIVIGRNDWNFFIWCCPEISSSVKGFGKKGLIKVVTPMNRIVSTIINVYNKQKEKYLLVNTKKHWVYYTNREFIMSNEVFSAGYNDALKNEDDG